MAKAFNLTAQINLQGPANIRPIVSNIKKQFSDIKADLKLNIDPKAQTKIASITKGIQGLTTATETATLSINKLNIGLTTLGSSLGKIQSISGTVNSSINKVASSSKSVASSSKQAATGMEAFGGSVALAAKRFAAFSAATTIIYGLINSINSAISEFMIYDRELIRLTQVTGGTISQFSGLSIGVQEINNEVRRLSTTLGVSSQELIKAASTLAQAGLSANETKIALEALAKSSLAPSFNDITETTEGAIAALRQFGIGVGDLESALGSINQVAADFAVESDDIIKAIQRTGGVFASASRGVSSGTDALNEFIAVFTSVRATTRESAETIATGLRTIFTRIQRTTTVDALKDLGVELRDSEGKFVGAFEAIKRLSEGLSGIDPRTATFAEIIEELGGFRQIGKVIPLIQQFQTSQQALQSAQRGTNSLTKASEIAFYSLENQLARTREEFLALIADFANTGTVKAFTATTLGLARGFINVIGSLKPLLPLITTLATIKLSQKLGEFKAGFTSKLFGTNAITPSNLGASPTTTTSGISPTLGVSENTTALKNLTTSINNLSKIIQSRPGRTGFATGGLVGGVGNGDTIPALLTPGEFVIRKEAAKKLGSARLHKMNHADKLQGYNAGGFVGGIAVQKFAEGGFVPEPLTRKGPGDIEAYVQKIIIALEKAAKAAEKQAYRTARDTGATAIEAVKLAKEAGIKAAKEEASRITSAVTARGGATQYKEKDKIRAAEKRMISAINTGKDPSVKGATERRRTPGYLERETQAKPVVEAEKEVSESAKEIEKSLDTVSDSANNFDQKLTNVMLVLSNIALPQIKSFADSLKVTENALGRAAIQAVETGASLALSTSLGLQALGADKKTIGRATAAAGAFGALGGGLQAFASKNIENIFKENSKVLSSFTKTLQQTAEAPTAQLRVEAAAQLEKEFTKLAESTVETTEVISNYEWYENLGSVITESTSTYLALTTSLLAFQQATTQATAATIAKTTADRVSVTASVAGGAASTAGILGGFLGWIGKAGTFLARFNFWVQAVIVGFTVISSIFTLFTKTTGRTAEQLDKFGKSLEDLVKNGNNYSLANQRFTGQVLENYRKIKSTLPGLTVTEQKQTKLDVFGGTQSVDITGKPTQQIRSSSINQFNLLFDQFARTKLALKGLNVGAEQSINEFFQTLDSGSQSFKTFNQVINELTSSTNKAASEFEKLSYIRALTQPLDPSIQPMSKEEAERKLGAASIEEIRRVSKNYNAVFNENVIAAQELTDSFRRLQVSSLNFTDILTRINSSLRRLSSDTANAFDDALYSLQLFGESVNIRANTDASRQAEVLRNPAAFNTQELIRAIDTAIQPFQMDDRVVTLSNGDTKPLSEYAKQLKGNILALQTAETKVPIALRQFIEQRRTGEGTGTEGLEDTLKKLLAPIELDKQSQASIITEIIGQTEKSLTGEGTKSLDEIISAFPGMVKSMDSFRGSVETAAQSLDVQAESSKRVAEAANAFASIMNKTIALQIKASELRLNTELEIAQITGKRPGLQQLNAPFNATINRLTQSIGSSLDPAKIGEGISKTAADLQKAIKENQPAEEQARLSSNLTSLNQALAMLGDKNQRLINALDKLRQIEEERKGIGNIFQQMLKASTDPIARMDLESTFIAAERVRAGGTNINDINRTLEKFIPMLESSGGKYAEAAAKFKDEILSRSATLGAEQALQAGDILTYLRGIDLASFLRGDKNKIPRQNIEKELGIANTAIQTQIDLLSKGLNQGIADTSDAMSQFRDKFANIWPSIINEMEMFRAELNRINSEQNAINMTKPAIDLSEIDTMLSKSLQIMAEAAAFDNRTLTTTGLPASMFSGRESQALTSDFVDKYFNKERSLLGSFIGEGTRLKPKKIVDIETLNVDDILRALKTAADATVKSNPKLSERLRIEEENLSKDREKFIRLMESRQRQKNDINIPPVVPSRRSFLENKTNTNPSPSPSPSPSPMPIGGQFSIPPQNKSKTGTAFTNATLSTLDFDYNDFITKFNRAFDSQTGKFREAVGSLSLAFQALNPPVDKFSASVTKLIDELNAINDAGGIKGPKIPEKVTVEVVFNEDLTIDTSKINNNDLLKQIGVVTSQAINDRIAELKLTGK